MTTAGGSVTTLYGTAATEKRQRAAIRSGDVPVAVYGLGKMGLPLAAVYAEVTGNVIGVDVDPSVVQEVNAGECHITGEPGLPELVARQVSESRLRATTEGQSAAVDASVHVVIVPTLLSDGEPDLSTVEAVARDVATGLAPGDLVVVESTMPPGTCREVVLPTLEEESGLERGEFGLAFCPERTASGRALQDIRGAYPKVVGGVDDESTRAAAVLYDELTHNDVHLVSDATTAEAVKVFEGIYRDVNIALANELARMADGLSISIREAIATANESPFCDIHDPGPGVGGHCIPYYPYFLFARTDEQLTLTRTARRINEEMPAYTVAILADELADAGVDLEDASVLVLGLTYRPGVEETRASPALEVVDRLREIGADVAATDPLVDPATYDARPIAVDDVADETFDAAVLVTPHAEFEAIDWTAMEPTVVLDGRDALELEDTHHRVRTLGGSRGDRPVVLEDEGRTERRASLGRTDGGERGD